MLQSLKYGDRPRTGYELGRLMAIEYYSLIKESQPDCLIPVPIHRSKRKTRGYNQSEWIARGMAEVLELPVDTDHLSRKSSGRSQTRKSRWLRNQEINSSFEFNADKGTCSQHFILVDDVFTTGATAEACCLALADGGKNRISVLTLGFAWS